MLYTRTVAIAVFLGSEYVGAQTQSCSYTSPRRGQSVSFASLGSANGNIAVTPLGNARINPCTKVTICDALQPGSICCIQINSTTSPGTGSWVSCGTTWTFTTAMSEASMVVGMVLNGGADCGYVFAPGIKVTASIAFVCDQSAVGGGRVAASKTGFLKDPASAAGASAGGGIIGTGPVLMNPAMFCNLNFTWSTSSVCNLPRVNSSAAGNWGMWVLILGSLAIGAYFGGFTYYRSTQPGAAPVFMDNLHAKEFWDELPNLIKDGISFVQSGGQAQAHYTQYASIDEDPTAKPKPKPKEKGKGVPKGKGKGKGTPGPPPHKSANEEDEEDEAAEKVGA